MPIRSFPILASLCALAWAEIGSAQSVPSPYRFFDTSHEIGVFGGQLSPGRGPFDLGPGPGPVVGVRYGLEVSGPISMEAAVSYMPTTRNVVDPGRVEGDRVIEEADVEILTADLRVKLSLTGRRTWNNLNPFLVAGGGVTVDLSGGQPEDERLLVDDRFEMGTGFIGVAGGGLRWFLSDHFVARGDALLNLWKLDMPLGWRDPERELGPVGEGAWVSGPLLTLGIGYRF
ncbi:MAG: hypothetical protein KY453_04005 [Gemmatimonadetes bacterium]|nr:hypothetical protein [Gemmatimonadota bacterium]